MIIDWESLIQSNLTLSNTKKCLESIFSTVIEIFDMKNMILINKLIDNLVSVNFMFTEFLFTSTDCSTNIPANDWCTVKICCFLEWVISNYFRMNSTVEQLFIVNCDNEKVKKMKNYKDSKKWFKTNLHGVEKNSNILCIGEHFDIT